MFDLKLIGLGTAILGGLGFVAAFFLPMSYTSEKDDPSLAEGTTEIL